MPVNQHEIVRTRTSGPSQGADRSPIPWRVSSFPLVLAAAFLFILRQPASLLSPTLYAEDGTVFFKDAIEVGWRALVLPYNGQLFLLQRLIAALAAPFPIAVQPLLYAASSVAVAVASCAIIISPRWRARTPMKLRATGMLALLCSPGLGDSFATLSNVHWWLGVGLILVGLLRDPESRWIGSLEMIYVAVASLSGFVILYALPVLVVRLYRERSRISLGLVSIGVVGMVVQGIALASSIRRGSVVGILESPATDVLVFGKRILATLVFGEQGLATGWALRTPAVGVLIITVLFGLVVAFVWWRNRGPEIAAVAACVGGGWLLALWALTPAGATVDMLLWPWAAARLFVVPRAAILIGLLTGARRFPVDAGLLGCAGVMVLSGIVSDYRIAEQPHVAWSVFAACVDHSRRECSVKIPPGWTVVVRGRGD